MKAIETFQLRQVDAGDAYRAPRSELVSGGRPLGITIDGAHLESQFAVDDTISLLLVTDDTPYEETLRAYLLTAGGTVLDEASLAYAYTPGILRDVRIAGPQSLVFDFAGANRFRLTVHDRPRHFWSASGGVGEAARFLRGRRLQFSRESSDAQ